MEEKLKRVEEIRKQMGEILKIQSFTGIENENVINYKLDNADMDKFNNLKEELKMVNAEIEKLTPQYKAIDEIKARIEEINTEMQSYNEQNDAESIKRTKLEVEKYNLQQKLRELLKNENINENKNETMNKTEKGNENKNNNEAINKNKNENENGNKTEAEEEKYGKARLGIFRALALKAIQFFRRLFKNNERINNILGSWENSLMSHAVPILDEGKSDIEKTKIKSNQKIEKKDKGENKPNRNKSVEKADSAEKIIEEIKQNRIKDCTWLYSKVKEDDDKWLQNKLEILDTRLEWKHLNNEEKLQKMINEKDIPRIKDATALENVLMYQLRAFILNRATRSGIARKDENGNYRSLESIYTEMSENRRRATEEPASEMPDEYKREMLEFLWEKSSDFNIKNNLTRQIIDQYVMPKIDGMKPEEMEADFKKRKFFEIIKFGSNRLENNYKLGLISERVFELAKDNEIPIVDKNNNLRPFKEIYEEIETIQMSKKTVRLDRTKGNKHYDRKELYQRKKNDLKWLSNKIINDSEQFKNTPEPSLILKRGKEISLEIDKMSEEELKDEIRRKKIPAFENSQIEKVQPSTRVLLYRLRLDLIKTAREMGINTNKREITDIYTDMMSRGISNPNKTEKNMDNKTQGDR